MQHQHLMVMVAVRLVEAFRWEVLAVMLCLFAQPIAALFHLGLLLHHAAIAMKQTNISSADSTPSSPPPLPWEPLFQSAAATAAAREMTSFHITLASLLFLVACITFRLVAPPLPSVGIKEEIADGSYSSLEEGKVNETNEQQQQQANLDLELKLSLLLGKVDKLQSQVAKSACWGTPRSPA